MINIEPGYVVDFIDPRTKIENRGVVHAVSGVFVRVIVDKFYTAVVLKSAIRRVVKLPGAVEETTGMYPGDPVDGF